MILNVSQSNKARKVYYLYGAPYLLFDNFDECKQHWLRVIRSDTKYYLRYRFPLGGFFIVKESVYKRIFYEFDIY